MDNVSLPLAPLISHDTDGCQRCWACVRVCPVKAIRVVGDRWQVVQEKCVGCGLCAVECARGGHLVRDDRPIVRSLLKGARPVVALLASEFVAALHPMTVSQIERALEALGFRGVETTVLGEEIVAEAYKNIHLREGSLVSIRSTCPVAVAFVRTFYPALVGALAPVIPPYIAQARLIRSVYAHDHAIVYVSPCYARKDEFRDPQFEGVIDAVIDFSELKSMFEELGELPQQRPDGPGFSERPGVLKELSLTDGFPRHTVETRDLTDASMHVVRGLDEIDQLLAAIMAGEAGPTIIDMLNCEGCIDGPAVNPGLSVFAKRNLDAAMRNGPGATHVSTRAMLAVLPSVETVRSFRATPVAVPEPTPAEVAEILADGRFTPETVLDCGACGWPTCAEHAAAIFRAESTWDLCLPFQRALLEEQASVVDSQRAALAEAQTLDPLTGLWNRRVFAERLTLELARHDRYGDPVSIAIMDVDGLGALNDELGRDGGDAVLIGIAERIARSVRATDVAARWFGDQFALILPRIGKTAAFVVGEKLRETVGGMPFSVAVDGYTRDGPVTISVGIATAAEGPRELRSLLEAADGALHDAMAAGSDRVQLAPG